MGNRDPFVKKNKKGELLLLPLGEKGGAVWQLGSKGGTSRLPKFPT